LEDVLYIKGIIIVPIVEQMQNLISVKIQFVT
jgi:hypothetical protein